MNELEMRKKVERIWTEQCTPVSLENPEASDQKLWKLIGGKGTFDPRQVEKRLREYRKVTNDRSHTTFGDFRFAMILLAESQKHNLDRWMEHPVGTVFRIKNKTVKKVEGSPCSGFLAQDGAGQVAHILRWMDIYGPPIEVIES